ncbi:flagella biosynthesis regulatory protein FliZ, partial [Escherichia coli]|uniref:flagella biosynthesis regulatory protein FliZ n=1 Tax=Escherichia coli TaxID=562 RepID=UPI0020372447
AQFAYDGSQLLTIFEIKLNGADFFFFSKHVLSPESPGNRPHPPLCRFCGDLHCKTQSDFFDIIGFKQFLFEQTEMSPGTVREYVVRLRRLGNHLHEQNISLDQLQDGFLDEILAPWLPTTSTNNYRIALRKYQHYQRQTCTGLVQKSTSLPASDIY